MELYEKGKKIGTVEFTTQYDPNPEPPKKNDYGMRLWKGLPSVDGNEIKTDELRKIYELKRIEHENLTIQSRILKLEKEGQKAEKKIPQSAEQKEFFSTELERTEACAQEPKPNYKAYDKNTLMNTYH